MNNNDNTTICGDNDIGLGPAISAGDLAALQTIKTLIYCNHTITCNGNSHSISSNSGVCADSHSPSTDDVCMICI